MKVVRNPDGGLWGEERSFELVEDMRIGVASGDSNEVFGRIYDIAVDTLCNVFILDRDNSRVQKFTGDGMHVATIGRKGNGPGELMLPTALDIDGSGLVLVADMNNRISVFDTNGTFYYSFDLKTSGSIVRSVKADSRGRVHVSQLDIVDQEIIHTYSIDGEYLFSFCDTYAKGTDVDIRLESFYAGGKIDIDDNDNIYFTQMIPYEIRKYSPDGVLQLKIFRKNSFMPEVPERLSGDDVAMTTPPTSYSILVLNDGGFINTVKIPPIPEPPPAAIIDLYDGEGNLLASKRVDRNMNVKCQDVLGRIYVVDHEDYPDVIRYTLSY